MPGGRPMVIMPMWPREGIGPMCPMGGIPMGGMPMGGMPIPIIMPIGFTPADIGQSLVRWGPAQVEQTHRISFRFGSLPSSLSCPSGDLLASPPSLLLGDAGAASRRRRRRSRRIPAGERLVLGRTAPRSRFRRRLRERGMPCSRVATPQTRPLEARRQAHKCRRIA